MRVVRPTPDRFDETLDVLRAADVARVRRLRLDRERPPRRVGRARPRARRVARRARRPDRRRRHLLDRKGGRFIGDGYVHPELTGRRRRSRVLDLLESRVLELRPEWPDELRRIVLEAAHLVGDDRAPELFRERGFERARSFFRMVADVGGEQPAPSGRTASSRGRSTSSCTARRSTTRSSRPSPTSGSTSRSSTTSGASASSAGRGFDPSLVPVAWDGEQVVAFSRNYSEAERRLGLHRHPRRPPGAGAGAGSAWRSCTSRSGGSATRARRPSALGVDVENPTGATRLYERAGCACSGRPTSGRRSSVPVPDVALRAGCAPRRSDDRGRRP